MKITKQILKDLNPCSGSWKNYLEHYNDWEGTFLEFLDLEKVLDEDKVWVFKMLPFEDKVKRAFAFECADRAVTSCDCQEVKDLFMLILFLFEDDPNFDSAADWAADWAAERKTQIDIIKYVLKNNGLR